MNRTTFVNATSLLLVVAAGATCSAANVSIPATEVFATGVIYSFQTDRDWLPTDILDIQAEGQTCTLAGCEIILNAAGIVAFDIDGLTVGDPDHVVYSYAEGSHQGALILGIEPFLDGDRPWIQLIRPSAANGQGASIVPSTVSSQRMLANYGGFLTSTIAAGTTLYLATADFNHSDNSRSYFVSTVLPKPASLTMFATVAIVLAANGRRKLFLTGRKGPTQFRS